MPRARVIQHLGRKDQLDIEALKRLVKSISRFIDVPADGEDGQRSLFDVARFEKAPVEFLGARSLGAVWLLDGLWKRFGIDRILGKLLEDREFTTPIERLLFALVANRAVAPCSKLAMEDWIAKDVVVPGLVSRAILRRRERSTIWRRGGDGGRIGLRLEEVAGRRGASHPPATSSSRA